MKNIILIVLIAVLAFVFSGCGGTATVTPVDKKDTVYVTENGKKYHRKGCRYLDKSSIPMSKEEAIKKGYEPCDVCKPY
jgi:uncharacterized protein YceK